MNTLERLAPAYIVRHRNRHREGGCYSRTTNDFTASEADASPVSKAKAAKLLTSYADGTLTVTPVAGKPLVR